MIGGGNTLRQWAAVRSVNGKRYGASMGSGTERQWAANRAQMGGEMEIRCKTPAEGRAGNCFLFSDHTSFSVDALYPFAVVGRTRGIDKECLELHQDL